jgi:Fe-S-cluster containining protein
MADLNCQACGACCTGAVSDDATGTMFFLPISELEFRRLPKDVVCEVDPMGLGKAKSLAAVGRRCAALDGVVGMDVSCRVYEKRPKICRVFPVGSKSCLAARKEVLS